MAVKVIIHGDLTIFLPKGQRASSLEAELSRRTSIKDFLEALGIPHPEIYRLKVNGREKDFAWIVEGEDQIEVFPAPHPYDPTATTLLRPGLKELRFAVDVNVSRLARLLRMAGFDAFFDPQMDDDPLAETAAREERLLLTRDRALLKRKIITHGRLVRSSKPAEQLKEVITIYGLQDRVRPFSRCLLCNEILLPVAKEKIIDRLKPLTRKYFDDFHICTACERIYWPGSHRDNMLKYFKGINYD